MNGDSSNPEHAHCAVFISHAGNKLIIILKLPPKPNMHFLEEHAVVGEIHLYNRTLCPPTAAEVPLEVHHFYLIFPQKKSFRVKKILCNPSADLQKPRGTLCRRSD